MPDDDPWLTALDEAFTLLDWLDEWTGTEANNPPDLEDDDDETGGPWDEMSDFDLDGDDDEDLDADGEFGDDDA
jgi:hypothetical protein